MSFEIAASLLSPVIFLFCEAFVVSNLLAFQKNSTCVLTGKSVKLYGILEAEQQVPFLRFFSPVIHTRRKELRRCVTWDQLNEQVALRAGMQGQRVFGFLMSSQEGEPSLFAWCSQEKEGKKVIKQTIYQALWVCLSNLPYSRMRKYTWAENGEGGCLLSPQTDGK